jgi:hypothetical protein
MDGAFLPPVVTRLTGDLGDLASTIADAKALIASLDGKSIEIKVRTSGIAGPIAGAIAQVEALKKSLDGLDSKTVRVGVEGAGGVVGRGILGALFGGIGLGALRIGGMGALHWLIAGFAELAAVVIPATIAIGAWAAVWAQGATNVANHMQAVYATAESLANMGGQTAGQMVGLGDALQKAQNAANPDVYQALGAAIEVAREHSGGLVQAGLQLGRVFDTFSAKVVSDFAKGGALSGPLDSLTSHMVQDATGIGQVFGNLGHILLSLGSQMPGLAEVLLATLGGILHIGVDIVDMADKFRIAGISVITLAMGFEEFNRWGSLVTSGLTRMGLGTAEVTGNFFSLTRAAGVLKNILGVVPAVIGRVGQGIEALGANIPYAGYGIEQFGAKVRGAADEVTAGIAGMGTATTIGVAVGVAAIGVMIYELQTAKSSAQKFADGLQQIADKASNLNALNVLGSNFAQLTGELHQQTTAYSQLNTQTTHSLEASKYLSAYQNELHNEIGQTNSALGSTSQQFVTVAAHASSLANTYHTSLTGALLLADEAGVHLNQTLTAPEWALAQLKIANLVQGFKSMGAPIGAAGNDVLMLGIQSGLAASEVSKVNQAADEFMTNLTGGTSGVATFNQSLANMGSVVGHVQNNLGQFTGQFSLAQQQFASSLTSFTGKGAQAWVNFNQVVGSTAPQIIDWLRTAGAEGAIAGLQFTKAVLAMTEQLVPFASKSKIAQSELLGLAQDAGLNVKTWPDLIQQIREGHVSASELAQMVGQATAKMGDMAQVAANLGTVLQSQLIAAMDAGKLKASQVTAATVAYEKSVMNAGAAADSTNPKFLTLLGDLEKLGYSASGAAKLIQALNSQIANVPSSKTFTFYLRTVGTVPTGSVPIGGGGHINSFASGTRSAAPGWALVGERGPELVHLSGGQQIVPNHMLSGGGRGAASSSVPIVLHSHVNLDGREIFHSVQQETYQYNVDNATRDGRGRVRGVLVPR